MQATPGKRRKVTAAARLVKETYNSRVFSSVFGSGLYFDKTIFEGDRPRKVVITLEWETETTNMTPIKENENAKAV